MPSQNDHHRNKNSLLFKIRIISVHILYLVYSVFLWLKLIDLGVATGHQKINIIIAMRVWMVAFVMCLFVTAVFGLRGRSVVFVLFLFYSLQLSLSLLKAANLDPRTSLLLFDKLKALLSFANVLFYSNAHANSIPELLSCLLIK